LTLLKNLQTKLNRLSTVQLIGLFYLIALLISTLVLKIPFARREHAELSFLDALFTAASAVSVTGLSVVSIKDTFNNFGIFLLCVILQLGCLGIMSLSTFLWLMVGKKVSLKERQLIMIDQNQSNLSGLVYLVKRIFITIISIELAGGILLGVHFLNYYKSPFTAFKHGLFASISAITNAGFDLTGNSLIPFHTDYFVQVIIMMLIIIGAIGFPVIMEVFKFFTYIKKRQKYYFTLFTKLTTITFIILTAAGAVFIYLLDRSHFFQNKTWYETFFYSLFHSVTSKSAGLTTMDLNEFTPSNHLLMSILMFIGGSPSSASGGIRTTTFAIVVLTIIYFAQGKGSIKIFRREIHSEDILKSFVVITTAALLCLVAVLVLSNTESGTMMEVIFEVSSAFGTNGLSLGLTSELSPAGKLVIIFLMFIGRIGIISFLLLLRGKGVKENFHYPKERMTIG
jgi:potassium uptake TrkH family protein